MERVLGVLRRLKLRRGRVRERGLSGGTDISFFVLRSSKMDGEVKYQQAHWPSLLQLCHRK